MDGNQVLSVDTSLQTDSSENAIISNSSLLWFLIQVDLKLQDLLSKTNCTAYKVKKLYERLLEEFDEIDKSYLTIQESNVKRNLQDLNSICKESSKDVVKVISGYYSSLNEQSMSTISCAGNLFEHTKYYTELLTSFLDFSFTFQKQCWFSDVFLEPNQKWEPISFIIPRKAVLGESLDESQGVQDEDNDNCSNTNESINAPQLSLDLCDIRNSFSVNFVTKVDWKKHIERLKRTSQSLEIIEMKFFILRSRDIHFMQTLSRFQI